MEKLEVVASFDWLNEVEIRRANKKIKKWHQQ